MVIKNFIFNRDALRSRLNYIKLGESWCETKDTLDENQKTSLLNSFMDKMKGIRKLK